MRNAGERLGIVDDRRSAPQSHNSGEGRTDSRDPALAFQRFHQRRFFADFIRPGAGVHINLKIFPRTENVLADEAARVRVGHRLLHDLHEIAVLSSQINEARFRTHGHRRDHHAFDHRVRIMFKDQPVFASARFALVTVAQHVLGFGRLLGNERPLQPRRKPRTPTTSQVRRLYLVDDRVRFHAERLLDRLVAVEFQIAIEIRRAPAESLGDDLHFIGM